MFRHQVALLPSNIVRSTHLSLEAVITEMLSFAVQASLVSTPQAL